MKTNALTRAMLIWTVAATLPCVPVVQAQTAPPAVSSEALELEPPASADALEPTALEELLAPIALYPDALLGAMFATASHPQEVLDAGNWRLDKTTLTGRELDEAAERSGFGPGARMLLAFPSVLDMMCQNFAWTRRLGAVFNADQTALMAAVQRLRAQAVAQGNLTSTPEQEVSQRVVDAQQVVEITPTNPRVFHVPQYNPEAVYTQPAPVPAQVVPVPGELGVSRVVAGGSGFSTADVVAAGVIGFTAGIVLSNLFDDDRRVHREYYERYPCPYPRWGTGAFYYDNRPWSVTVYRYRPYYGYGFRPGYRPGWGYRPPPDYPWYWQRPPVWQRPPPGYGPQVVVNVHQTQVNYFNRFEGQGSQALGGKPRPTLVTRPVREQVNTHYRPKPKPEKPVPPRPTTATGITVAPPADRPTTRPVPRPEGLEQGVGRPGVTAGGLSQGGRPRPEGGRPPPQVPNISEQDLQNGLPPGLRPPPRPAPEGRPTERPTTVLRPTAPPPTRLPPAGLTPGERPEVAPGLLPPRPQTRPAPADVRPPPRPVERPETVLRPAPPPAPPPQVRPAPVERPVPVERPMPMDRPVPMERPATMVRPAPVERPMPVERPAPAARPAMPQLMPGARLPGQPLLPPAARPVAPRDETAPMRRPAPPAPMARPEPRSAPAPGPRPQSGGSAAGQDPRAFAKPRRGSEDERR